MSNIHPWAVMKDVEMKIPVNIISVSGERCCQEMKGNSPHISPSSLVSSAGQFSMVTEGQGRDGQQGCNVTWRIQLKKKSR